MEQEEPVWDGENQTHQRVADLPTASEGQTSGGGVLPLWGL